uniref:LYR motif containing 4 n=1 Tax=Gallus gallus TaxID=9031 RepID=A0A8V0Y9C9_CHICK
MICTTGKSICEEGRCQVSRQERTYAIRRIRDAFRENKSIKDSEKIEELVNKAKENLEIIHRQVTIGQMYATQKLVIESPGNT